MKNLYLIILVIFLLSSKVYSQTIVLSPTGDGGFENGETLEANGWTVVNPATNQWWAGTATSYAGTRSAYISNDNGASNQYTNSTSQVAHLYRDVVFPANEIPVLSFYWKGYGEGNYDDLSVYLTETGFVPVANTTYIGSATQIGATYSMSNSWNFVSIPLSIAYAGTTKRLIFSWRNDGYMGSNPPSAIDNIKIETFIPISGIKTIKASGGDYSSFTDAINAINLSGVGNGGITFLVDAGFEITENPPAITVSGTSSSPIIFQKSGSGANPKVTYLDGTGTADAVFKLNGADYVTFDGIDVSDNYTLTSDYDRAEYAFFLSYKSETDGTQYNTIKNCKITLNRENSLSKGIYSANVASSTAGTNSNNKFLNITIENSACGIYLAGSSYKDQNNEIGGINGGKCYIGGSNSNDIGGQFSSDVYGIYAYRQENISIHHCEIKNLFHGNYNYQLFGMLLTQVVGNCNIYNNSIHDIKNNSTASSQNRIIGIQIYLENINNPVCNIYNNYIYNITSSLTGSNSSLNIIGLHLYAINEANKTFNIYNNTIKIDASSSYDVTSSTCLWLNSYSTGTYNTTIKCMNNIFANYTSAQSGSYKHYCVYSYGTTNPLGTNSNWNFNDYYVHNTTNGFIGYAGSDKVTLFDWQAVSLNDVNSVNQAPPFVSANDLHIAAGSNTLLESGGTNLALFSDDYDGDTRPGPTGSLNGGALSFDIGADEFDGIPTNVCAAPANQPTNLELNSTLTTITGGFVAAASAPDGYLVVYSTSSELSSNPVNGTAYQTGDNFGNATVMQRSSSTTINATGLGSGAHYYIFVFSYNSNDCQGGPKYLTTSPLSGNIYTLPGDATAFTATSINSSQIDLSWALNAGLNDVIVAINTENTFGSPSGSYNVGDGISGGGTVIYKGNGTTYSVNGLSEYTTYYFKIWSFNPTGYSTGAGANAKTKCNPSPLPWTEGFETTTLTNIPDCWVQERFDQYYADEKWGTNTGAQSYYGTARTGSRYLYHYVKGVSNDWIITNSFNLTAGTQYSLIFWAKAYSTNSYSLDVYYGNTQQSSSLTNLLGTVTGLNSTYRECQFNFTPETSGTYFIGIKETTTSSPSTSGLTIDDMSLQVAENLYFNNAEVTQTLVTPVRTNSTNNRIIGVKINIGGTVSTINATNFTFNTNGTSNPLTDISNAKLYYTGSSSNFTTNTLFGEIASPNGVFNITGNQSLLKGDNYFWLTFDVPETATILNYLDAECTSIEIGGQAEVPDNTSVAGNRQIRGPLSGVYTVNNTQPTNLSTGGTNYANFDDVFTDLNSVGVSGAVTFNISAGQTFNATCSNVGIYSNTNTNYAYLLQINGTIATPVIFQKTGEGADPVINFTGASSTNINVGFLLYGADYITFDHLKINDAGTDENTYLDRAFYILNFGDDGANYNTLKNLNIDLTGTNSAAIGIYLYNNYLSSLVAPNNNNLFYNNILTDMNSGYYLNAFRVEDSGNIIGTIDGGTSSITNLYSNSSTTIYGIYAYRQKNFQCFNTTLNNFDASAGTSTIYGIFNSMINNSTIRNNTISNLSGNNRIFGNIHKSSDS
ncbi:MAG TPA: BNR-repeat neuraminidase N-terminal domain-containing protein, partial [Candidatus Kapabacteria bacterium]|nr:BNR-repeat neuraminidase N-terminal domain-containing protein [Candidatus Kapabacteria bacterium]